MTTETPFTETPFTETTLLLCGTCGAPARFMVNPGGLYAGPWDTAIDINCSNPACGQRLTVEYPTQQAVNYHRAESLLPIVSQEMT